MPSRERITGAWQAVKQRPRHHRNARVPLRHLIPPSTWCMIGQRILPDRAIHSISLDHPVWGTLKPRHVCRPDSDLASGEHMFVHRTAAQAGRANTAGAQAAARQTDWLSRRLLELQRTAGNASVIALLNGPAGSKPLWPPAPISGPPPDLVLQRGGLTSEDAELVGESVGRVVLGLWNLLVSYFGPSAPPPPVTAPDGNRPQGDDARPPGAGPGTSPPHTGQQLVVARSSSMLVLSEDQITALVGVIIRQEMVANMDLLRSLNRQAAHLTITRYSPDIEAGVVLIEQAKKKLEACRSIHLHLRSSLRQDQATAVAQGLGTDLLRFVAKAHLGTELSGLAEEISAGLDQLTFKRFKLSDSTYLGITQAATLLGALQILHGAVQAKLEEQERTATAKYMPTKFEIQAEERRRAREGKTSSVGELQEEKKPSDLPTPLPPPRPPLPGYVSLGVLHASEIFGRIDWHLIDQVQHHAVKKMQRSGVDYRAAYQAAMTNALRPASDTGTDCTKPEGARVWVVKISYPTATTLGLDNRLSPMAVEDRRGTQVYLTFDQITFRH